MVTVFDLFRLALVNSHLLLFNLSETLIRDFILPWDSESFLRSRQQNRKINELHFTSSKYNFIYSMYFAMIPNSINDGSSDYFDTNAVEAQN